MDTSLPGLAIGQHGGAGVSYLGGGIDGGGGVYVGLSGVGFYTTVDYTQGLGAYAGEGITVSAYSSLDAFAGNSVGAKVEGPVFGFSVSTSTASGSGVVLSLSGGAQHGAYVGATVSQTYIFDITDVLRNLPQ